MTTLAKLKSDPRVEFVDDERAIGNSLIITMSPGWTLDARDPHDGVFGADTVREAWATLQTAVRYCKPQEPLGFTATVPADASATQIVSLLHPQIKKLAAVAWAIHPNNPVNKGQPV